VHVIRIDANFVTDQKTRKHAFMDAHIVVVVEGIRVDVRRNKVIASG
jgi:hypothetical protein